MEIVEDSKSGKKEKDLIERYKATLDGLLDLSVK
jgi:hypothetical protein